MNREDIENKVIDVVVKALSVDKSEVLEKTNLISDLNADSLDAVEIVMGVEEEFNISIPDEDTNNLISVKNIVDYICDKIKE